MHVQRPQWRQWCLRAMSGLVRLNGSLHCWHADTRRSGVQVGGFEMPLSSSSCSDLPSTPLGCIESSGVKPSLLGKPTEAPRPTSFWASSMVPPNAAMWRAVLPVSNSVASRARCDSERLSRMRAAGSAAGLGSPAGAASSLGSEASVAERERPSPTALACCISLTARSASRCRTVWPAPFCSVGLAPCSMRMGTYLAAYGAILTQVCSGVLRWISSRLERCGCEFHCINSQRWMSSARTAGCPRALQAACNGVRPCTRSWRSGSAPCCTRQRTTLSCPSEHAQ
mmetsp:Transcript_46600/g.129513  ORF Transcript_46600/g.129513 Transcript_46600/m.129513 type:complete len:284 (-) Transcript_46600:1144-1995(-)